MDKAMTFQETHNKLNELFPGRPHRISAHFWQHIHLDGTAHHKLEWDISVHNPHIQVNSCPSLKDAMDKLRVTSQRAPEPTEAQSLAQADQTAKEMEEVL